MAFVGYKQTLFISALLKSGTTCRKMGNTTVTPQTVTPATFTPPPPHFTNGDIYPPPSTFTPDITIIIFRTSIKLRQISFENRYTKGTAKFFYYIYPDAAGNSNAFK